MKIFLNFSGHRAGNEKFKAFESRFEAALFRFRPHGDDITIGEALMELMILNGASLGDDQRFSILAASVTSITEDSASLFADFLYLRRA